MDGIRLGRRVREDRGTRGSHAPETIVVEGAGIIDRDDVRGGPLDTTANQVLIELKRGGMFYIPRSQATVLGLCA